MTRRLSRRVPRQLHLFRPRPQTPRWDRLPNEVRRKALPLIALLLQTARQAMKEVRNER
jgi:hypothetical protein